MKVLLFARARDLIGADQITVDQPDPATIGELRQRLIQEYPRAAGLLEKSVFAINDEFAADSSPIAQGVEVALLPPVSGG